MAAWDETSIKFPKNLILHPAPHTVTKQWAFHQTMHVLTTHCTRLRLLNGFEAANTFRPIRKNGKLSGILQDLFHLATPAYTCNGEFCCSENGPKQNIKRAQCWRNVPEHFQRSFTALLNTLVRKYFQSICRVSASIISWYPARCSSSLQLSCLMSICSIETAKSDSS